MKKFAFLLALLPLFCVVQKNVLSDNQPKFVKHELGVSWRAFPSAGLFTTDELFGMLDFISPLLFYTNDKDPKLSMKSFNFGSFNASYQYHFSTTHSADINFSW
jgi:hypothetical protein